MRFIDITLKQGFQEKNVVFSDKANMIYSKKNTVGKTTFLRAILYALGYPIPSTKGIKFEDIEFNLTVENDGKKYKLYRHNSYLSIDDGQEQKGYSLPTDFYEVMKICTKIDNIDVLDNLLGAFYMDQEKGWTLLNRGKVIGNIAFNIESLVRGLGGKDCDEQIKELEAVKRQIKKYDYMNSVAAYQEEISEAGENLVFDSADEIVDRRIEILQAERAPVVEELRQIQDILRKNKLLAEYISEMKLIVKSSTGEEILVTSDTLIDFVDNNNFLVARREMLASELEQINKKIKSLETQKKKDERIFKVQTIIEEFDADISKIHVDSIAIQNVINRLKKQKKNLQDQIRTLTKSDNDDIVIALHDCISGYAKELGISEMYVAPNKDYIFTNDLKSLTGTILHKIVFSFKLAYLKLIKEKTGLILPIVLDSPSGREVKIETVEEMLKIIQRDFSEHQLIVASIYDFDLDNKKVIEFKDRLFSTEDIIKISDSYIEK